MIGTIRKHSKALWAVIITIVVVTFVFWGSPGSKSGNQRDINLGNINGEPVDVEEYLETKREVYLLYFFSTGEWPEGAALRQGFDVERETYVRLLMLQKIKQEKIHVPDETVAKVAADLLRLFNKGNPVSIEAFTQNVLRQRGLTAGDFERYIRNYLSVQQLIAAHGASGRLVTPQEARVLYEREHEQLATEAVFFDATNYQANVSSTPEQVGQFFTNHMADYRLPERVQVSYVAFEITNLLAQSEAELLKTNFTEMIEANYQRIGTNSYKDAKTPEEIRARIRQDLIRGNAERMAKRQASEFANAVDEATPKTLATFEKLAADRQLKVNTAEPFDRRVGPKEFEVDADFVKEAFLRTPEDPFAGPFRGRDAAYVIALKARLPSEVPSLDSVREQVSADFLKSQAEMGARLAGEAFARTLTNGLAAGKTFSSICAEANLKPVTLPPFSLSTRSVAEIEQHVSLRDFKEAAFTTPVGHASGYVQVPFSGGGFVLFVRERMPMELAKLTAELPDYLESLRRTRQSEAYSQWFGREVDRGLREIPALRAPTQMGRPSGAPPKRR